MNYLKYEDKIILLLDTESLNENKIHDCQLTSIILLISHIVFMNSMMNLYIYISYRLQFYIFIF